MLNNITTKSKATLSMYFLTLTLNLCLAHLSFILLAVFTEFSFLWIFDCIAFTLLSFCARNLIKSKNNEKTKKDKHIIKKPIIVYLLSCLLTISGYSIIALLINSSAWIFMLVLCIIYSLYLIFYIDLKKSLSKEVD